MTSITDDLVVALRRVNHPDPRTADDAQRTVRELGNSGRLDAASAGLLLGANLPLHLLREALSGLSDGDCIAMLDLHGPDYRLLRVLASRPSFEPASTGGREPLLTALLEHEGSWELLATHPLLPSWVQLELVSKERPAVDEGLLRSDRTTSTTLEQLLRRTPATSLAWEFRKSRDRNLEPGLWMPGRVLHALFPAELAAMARSDGVDPLALSTLAPTWTGDGESLLRSARLLGPER